MMPSNIPDTVLTSLSKSSLDDEYHTEKLHAALSDSTIRQCIHDFPVIPALFLEAISVPNIGKLVTKEFLWQYWSKTLVEDQSDCPDITQIADLVQVSTPDGRKVWPPAPYQSIEQLSEAVSYE
jgi:hypothetical protein